MHIPTLIGGLHQNVDSQALYSAFLPFGEILDVQLPTDPAKRELEAYYTYIDQEKYPA